MLHHHPAVAGFDGRLERVLSTPYTRGDHSLEIFMRELVIVWIVLAAIAGPASGQERLVVTERAAVILTPVKTDSTAEFELGLAQLQAALEAASDPIKKQQAQGWKVYRAEEPIGPNALYVIILDPAVPFADYSFKRLLDSLPAHEAEAALKRLAGSLADAQRVFSMELHAVPPQRKPEPAKKKKEERSSFSR